MCILPYTGESTFIFGYAFDQYHERTPTVEMVWTLICSHPISLFLSPCAWDCCSLFGRAMMGPGSRCDECSEADNVNTNLTEQCVDGIRTVVCSHYLPYCPFAGSDAAHMVSKFMRTQAAWKLPIANKILEKTLKSTDETPLSATLQVPVRIGIRAMSHVATTLSQVFFSAKHQLRVIPEKPSLFAEICRGPLWVLDKCVSILCFLLVLHGECNCKRTGAHLSKFDNTDCELTRQCVYVGHFFSRYYHPLSRTKIGDGRKDNCCCIFPEARYCMRWLPLLVNLLPFQNVQLLVGHCLDEFAVSLRNGHIPLVRSVYKALGGLSARFTHWTKK